MRGFVFAGSHFDIEAILQRTPEHAAWCREPFAEKKWAAGLYRFYKPERLERFLEIAPLLTDAEYWRILAGLWSDAEMPNVNRAWWLEAFLSPRPGRENLMGPEDQKAFKSFPERLTIYRGGSYPRGMAWTLNPEIAAFFCKRFQRNPESSRVYKATIPKRKVLAYLGENQRDEDEILIDPRKIRYSVMPWTPERIEEEAAEWRRIVQAHNESRRAALEDAQCSTLVQ